MKYPSQGDILAVSSIPDPVLVVSRNELNEEGRVIVCPVMSSLSPAPVHKRITYQNKKKTADGYVSCENPHLLDLRTRHFSKISELDLFDMMDVSDILVALFEYV